MSGRGFCRVGIAVLMALLVGCAGNVVSPDPQPSLPPELLSFPDDVDPSPAEENIRRQQDLAQRNLYQTRDGHVRLLSAQACALDLVAHRGHIDYPENSLSGVKAAFSAGFSKVEVDIMRLRDGTWVLHHDVTTGRASGFSDGRRAAINTLTAAEFSTLRVRDPKTFQLTRESAPTLLALVNGVSSVMTDQQRLQIEFKSGASIHELAAIDRTLAGVLGRRYEYVAQDIELLAKLRQLNPWVYLGVIEVPASTSMLELHRQKAEAQNVTPTRLSRTLEQRAQETYRRTRTNWLTPSGMATIQQRLGSNAGIHVDHAALIQQVGAVERTAKLNMPLYTYAVTGHAPHLSSLSRLKNQRAMPRGAIVDDTHLKVCGAFFDVIPPPLVEASPKAFILRLPADADFAMLADQQHLHSSGRYRANGGDIIRLPSPTSSRAAITRAPALLHTDFKAVEDESLDLRRDGALRIHLHARPAPDKPAPDTTTLDKTAQ